MDYLQTSWVLCGRHVTRQTDRENHVTNIIHAWVVYRKLLLINLITGYWYYYVNILGRIFHYLEMYIRFSSATELVYLPPALFLHDSKSHGKIGILLCIFGDASKKY